MFAVTAAQTRIAAPSQTVLTPMDLLMCVTAGAEGGAGCNGAVQCSAVSWISHVLEASVDSCWLCV